MTTLAEKLLAVHERLDDAGIRHAFGGAIALGYCTEQARATIDLDINIFTPVGEADATADALPSGVVVSADDRRRIKRDGQVRLWWDRTPIDLFFSSHPFHDRAAERVRFVPFAGVDIPVLDCTDLVVFKALFARTKDWVDIETAARMGTVDEDDALANVASLLGDSDATVARLRETFEAAHRPEPEPPVLGRL